MRKKKKKRKKRKKRKKEKKKKRKKNKKNAIFGHSQIAMMGGKYNDWCVCYGDLGE